MAAALAFQAKIRTHSQHLPFTASAGMLFFETQYVSNLYIHVNAPAFRHSCAKISPMLPCTTRSAAASLAVGVLLTSTSLFPL